MTKTQKIPQKPKAVKSKIFIEAYKMNNLDYNSTKKYLFQVAEECEISKVKMGRIVKNNTSSFSVEELLKISEEMKISIDKLVSYE